MDRRKALSYVRPCAMLLCFYFGTISISDKGAEAASSLATENRKAQIPGAQSQKNDAAEGRVRVGLRLTPYGAAEHSGAKAEPLTVLRYTLRANLTKPNHFFFQGFHIETMPQSWNRKTNLYTMKLYFSKQFGQEGEIEERLGELQLKGKLIGEGGLFVLHGSATKQFKNKFTQPILDVVAGYQPASAPPLSQASQPGHENAPPAPGGRTIDRF